MAIYVITGEPGTGKSLLATSRIQKALWAGRRVATNMDLRLEGLVSNSKPRNVTRLPDWPTCRDLEQLGLGYEGRGFDERKFGWIVLDEAATFLNAREWAGGVGEEDRGERQRQAKDRMRLITWLRQVRKFRWHLVLLTQELGGLDKQVRDALSEQVVQCKRLDRFALPFLTAICAVLGIDSPRLPQVHIGVVRIGQSKNSPVADRWLLLNGKALHCAYDTSQRYFGENDGAATFLDHRHAPYLWKPAGLYEALWERWLWRWVPPTAARARHDDFRLYESGAAVYKPAAVHVSFADFEARMAQARAAVEPSSGERAVSLAIAA